MINLAFILKLRSVLLMKFTFSFFFCPIFIIFQSFLFHSFPFILKIIFCFKYHLLNY